MNNADIIWNLMKKLEQKENELNQAIEIIQKNNLSLDFIRQNEVE